MSCFNIETNVSLSLECSIFTLLGWIYLFSFLATRCGCAVVLRVRTFCVVCTNGFLTFPCLFCTCRSCFCQSVATSFFFAIKTTPHPFPRPPASEKERKQKQTCKFDYSFFSLSIFCSIQAIISQKNTPILLKGSFNTNMFSRWS